MSRSCVVIALKWLLLVAVISGGALAQDLDAGVPVGTLALPEATLTPAGSGVVVTASAKDGFSIKSADENWGLRIGGVFWAAFNDTIYLGDHAPHFSVPLARLQIRAHVFRPWLRLFFQPEFAGLPRVLDLEFIIQPWDALGLKVGQMQPAFSRAWLSPVPKLQFQGFTPANSFFRPDRQAGALLFGSFFGGRLEYFAGVFDGVGINRTANDNPHMMWNARVAGTLFGTPANTKAHVKYDETAHLAGDAPPTLMVGIDGYVNRVTAAGIGANGGAEVVEQQVASVDLSFTWQRFFMQAEGYLMRSVPIANSFSAGTQRAGADFQAGFFLIRSVLELAGRFSWLRADANIPGLWLVQGDGQLNYYVAGNNLKIGARYSATYAHAGFSTYLPGLSHTVFVQAQVWL
jgi:hypothetical protein